MMIIVVERDNVIGEKRPVNSSTLVTRVVQAIARIFRIGQVSPTVRAVTLLTVGTVEETVLGLRLAAKKNHDAASSKSQSKATQATFAGLTEDQIESLIAPRKETTE